MPDTYSFQTEKTKIDHQALLNCMLVHDEPIGIVLNENTSGETLAQWVEAAQNAGVSLDDIGVFFRQENTNNNQRMFNAMIKEYKLNKPVAKNLKIYFLGPKYNKSLIKEKVVLRYFICDEHYVSTHHNMLLMLTNALLKVYYLSQDKKLGDEFVVL
jgi:hypothetical protein